MAGQKYDNEIQFEIKKNGNTNTIVLCFDASVCSYEMPAPELKTQIAHVYDELKSKFNSGFFAYVSGPGAEGGLFGSIRGLFYEGFSQQYSNSKILDWVSTEVDKYLTTIYGESIDKIIIAGCSRGGIVAIQVASLLRQKLSNTPISFIALDPIAPPHELMMAGIPSLPMNTKVHHLYSTKPTNFLCFRPSNWSALRLFMQISFEEETLKSVQGFETDHFTLNGAEVNWWNISDILSLGLAAGLIKSSDTEKVNEVKLALDNVINDLVSDNNQAPAKQVSYQKHPSQGFWQPGDSSALGMLASLIVGSIKVLSHIPTVFYAALMLLALVKYNAPELLELSSKPTLLS